MKTPLLTIDKSRAEVFVKGVEVKLAPKEQDILALLHGDRRIHSREGIMEVVWGNTAPIDSRTVDQHVARLRRKLKVPVIVTVTTRGYKWATK